MPEKKRQKRRVRKRKTADSIDVYVCGKVRKEGVVTLPAGSRIYQAIEMAGGIADDAAASYLNLAEVLTDGADLRPWNR